jgi:hypothetical protein
LNQESKILDISEYYWQRERENEPAAGTFWRDEEGVWTLYSETDARVAVARLALQAARRLGESSRTEVWVQRMQNLEYRAQQDLDE